MLLHVVRMTGFRALVRAATAIALLPPCALAAQDVSSALSREIDRRAPQLEARAVAWRRDIHQHPELSNRETRTSKLVADHLKALGIEVRTGVAKTGVVGVLRGGRPGPVVALRADMDALPVAEEVDVPLGERITRLEKEMRAAAKRLEFEEAAALRDQIKELRELQIYAG